MVLIKSLLVLFLVVTPAPIDRDTNDRGLGYLGLTLEDEGDAILVKEVLENSPAAKAGIRKDDRIRKCAGKQVGGDLEGFIKQTARTRPGTVLPVELERGGSNVTLDLRIGARPGDFQPRRNLNLDLEP
jgi:S1-C subfamily serine protease